MKLVIAALNAKYVHTSLSVRCLYTAVKGICECSFSEYTINDSPDATAADLYEQGADAVAFSCYIWNIEKILKISQLLKLANPQVKIILGGYEVMYDAKNILKNNPFVDIISIGEGEIVFKNLVSALSDGTPLSEVRGVAYRNGGGIILTETEERCAELDSLPFVYDESILEIKEKIIYYESSRGCPYSCTYCISGQKGGVRFLSVERVKRELKFFADHGVKLVKFVDRTFNANPKRAKEIFEFIIKNGGNTCYHMELAGDIIDDETIELLKTAPNGRMQFEIGVQTTNSDTMNSIQRRISFEKIKRNVSKLLENGNIHIHLDLIAGLPYENMQSFKKSFNDVIALRPHMLQLGFLKMLKGSKIRADGDEHGYVYRPYPPYEVISNLYISYADILELKRVEEALDRYYNSGSFRTAMDYLFGKYADRYLIFYDISGYIKTHFKKGTAFSAQTLFDILYECFKDFGNEFSEALKYDYLVSFRTSKRPYWFDRYDNSLTQKTYDMFKNEELKKIKFPCYYDVPAKEIMKHVHAERFSYGIVLFDYKEKKTHDITEYADMC